MDKPKSRIVEALCSGQQAIVVPRELYSLVSRCGGGTADYSWRLCGSGYGCLLSRLYSSVFFRVTDVVVSEGRGRFNILSSEAIFISNRMESLSSLDRLADIVSEAAEAAEETSNRDDTLMDCPFDVLMEDVAMGAGETHEIRDIVQNGLGSSMISVAEVLEMEFENPEEASCFYERYSRAKGFAMRQGRS
ncbi:hypothetical protein PIB30_006094 [Stylosanthes scabra]|uniref:Uncharacterized protein n=1 Tax=Stylosanthes scabra TaxID=79078 RepID=A0ABU6V3L3_9FABA|nr:hypothetical protein [Stylosanthes scabra]